MSEKIEAPKGTRDFLPGSMLVREKVISSIEDIFRKFGFQKWDGPAFEYLSTLTLKSSPEIVREIYNFQDKGARDLGLRFELTSSIARMMAANPRMKKPVKAYGIGKVWRYENTQKGRYREFLQMDVDIFGCASVNAEMELFSIRFSRSSEDRFFFDRPACQQSQDPERDRGCGGYKGGKKTGCLPRAGQA